MRVILARPRGFCAGVVRAVRIVDSALKRCSGPIHVLHEIVHNHRVVAQLRSRGAIFVNTLADVPAGGTVIFSAHGVAPEILRHAQAKGLTVIDATCPLVNKVHHEVALHARAGREVILIGHPGHPEVIGTVGHYDERTGVAIHVVDSARAARALRVRQPGRLAYVTQTTLSVDDTAEIVGILRARFPEVSGPRIEDICYATQNRQGAVKALARRVQVILVVGARNSSNSNRLREVAEKAGVRAHLLQETAELRLAWLRGCRAVGITAGASTPEVLVCELLEVLRNDLGAGPIEELDAEPEAMTFCLPEPFAEVRRAEA